MSSPEKNASGGRSLDLVQAYRRRNHYSLSTPIGIRNSPIPRVPVWSKYLTWEHQLPLGF